MDDDIKEEFEFDTETLNTIEPEDDETFELDTSFDGNLVPLLEDDVCEEIGSKRQEVYTGFKNSREQWEEYIIKGIRWLGLSPENDANLPTEDSCTAVHPLLMESVVKFQAKAIQELWPAAGPVRTKVRGYVSPEREAVAVRVKSYMNYQLTEQVPGFYNDLERNLFRVAFLGTGIRKAGWNPATQAPDPTVVNIENFFVDPAVSHLRHADEYVEYIEMSKRMMQSFITSGHFHDCDDLEMEEALDLSEITQAINEAQGFENSTERKGFVIGESHCYLDLEGSDPFIPDGGLAPYIVHFNIKTGKVYSIRRNWEESDAYRTKILRYTTDSFIPAFGFYSLGFLHLIGALSAASSAAMRALVDAGQFANWQAGFKSKDAKFSDSDTPLSFGEFRDVDLSPEELKNAFLPLPAKEPSQVLFALLQFMVASGQKFADATDEVVQNSTNYGPGITTLALLEAGMRFYSSIHKRLHQSQQEFFKLLGWLNFKNLPPRVNYVVGSENAFVQNVDFNPEIVNIIPASDPNALSESQRIAKAQVELETAARFPQQHNLAEALRRFYVAMGTENPEKLMRNADAEAISADPMTELQAAMTGKPIKAQLGQNHAAHIAVKEAFLKSPQMQGVNDPTVAVGLEILKANISEHKTLIFIAQAMQMAQQAGLPMQDENVQAFISQKMVEESAASGMGGGMNIEAEMLKLNQAELALSQERIKSQDVRESAKIAQKNEELELKKIQLLMEAQDKDTQNKIQSSKVLLDNASRLADSRAKALSERAAGV